MDSLLETPIEWRHTGDGEYPYQFSSLAVRVNDFPAEPLYTLLVFAAEPPSPLTEAYVAASLAAAAWHDGVLVAGAVGVDLEDWPPAWIRPPLPPDLRAMAIPRP